MLHHTSFYGRTTDLHARKTDLHARLWIHTKKKHSCFTQHNYMTTYLERAIYQEEYICRRLPFFQALTSHNRTYTYQEKSNISTTTKHIDKTTVFPQPDYVISIARGWGALTWRSIYLRTVNALIAQSFHGSCD